jgi:hypothetical protein
LHETIGVTGNHPFWSLDRLEFVQVGELAIGERLQTLSGDTKWVQHKLPRPGPEPVYNLEIHAEHVYYVGTSGVLAHNVCPGDHHMVPRSLGSKTPYRHSSLTNLTAAQHTKLHKKLTQHLKTYTKTLANGKKVDMLPRRGNSGRDVRQNFSKQERLHALSDFYKKYEKGKYMPNFLNELRTATQNGWVI